MLSQGLHPATRCLHTTGDLPNILIFLPITTLACALLQMCRWWATQQARTW